MFKISKEKAPNYLINLVPKCEPTIGTRENSITNLNCRTDCFKHSFFPSTLNDWFNLDLNIRNVESVLLFKSRLLSFICPVQGSIFNILNPKGLKFLTHLRLASSHLNEDRFRHNFQNCLNLLCSCSLEIKDTSYYLLHCIHFSHNRVHLVNSAKLVCDNFESMSNNVKKDLLLFSDSRFDENKIKVILEATVSYIKNYGRFSGSLFE